MEWHVVETNNNIARKVTAQCLGVCPKAPQAQEKFVVDLVDLLVIRRESLKLDAEAQIAPDCYTLFSRHSHNGGPIVFKNLH